MFSKTKENILFWFIIVSIILMTVKALTVGGRYNDMIKDLDKKIEEYKIDVSTLKTDLSRIKQIIQTNNISIKYLETKFINHRHNLEAEKLF